jgi:hypothetical protein
MLNPKFVRAHYALGNPAGTKGALQYLMKLCYEFWGFCVNGDNNLTGTVASYKGFPSGGISMPTGFENMYLHSSGSDGITHLNFPYFSSSAGNFTGSIVGKHLVLWKSGSTSTDDSIYEITKIIDSSTLLVNPFSGGTPSSSSNWRPTFTERSSINYRIVDIAATSELTYVSGNFMVFNLNGAPLVNSGALKSQIKLGLSYNSGPANSIRMTIAPSGSWNGSTFTEGVYEFLTDTGNSSEWGSKTSAQPGFITLVGAQDFLFANACGDWWAVSDPIESSGFYFEVPERLYPLSSDPNPVTGMLYALGQSVSSTTKGWNSFKMLGRDNVLRRWTTVFRSPIGDGYGVSTIYPTSAASAPAARYLSVVFNQWQNYVNFSDALLHLPVAGQFSLGRCRLRRLRFCTNSLPNDQIAGNVVNNYWYHMFDVVWIPWDGARLPQGLFPFGA